jgi:hypothetical protein
MLSSCIVAVFYFSVLMTTMTIMTSAAECVTCSKMLPVCLCSDSEVCVRHPQNCHQCAYAECLSAASNQKSLPPIPFDLVNAVQKMDVGPEQVLTDDDPEPVFCAQVVPECNCQAEETCRIVKQSRHQCSWAACLDAKGCVVNCPDPRQLCQRCKAKGLGCSVIMPQSCGSCAAAVCKKAVGGTTGANSCQNCPVDQVCEVTIENGRPRMQCLPLAGTPPPCKATHPQLC